MRPVFKYGLFLLVGLYLLVKVLVSNTNLMLSMKLVHVPHPPAGKWQRPLLREFDYETAKNNMVVPMKKRHPWISFTPEINRWKPIHDCDEIEDSCFFYPTGIFDPPLDGSAIRKRARRIANGEEVVEGACTVEQLDKWEIDWAADSTGDNRIRGKNCRLPELQTEELLTSWLAAAERNGQSHPLIVVRGDSVQRNMMSRASSFIRGMKEHHDRGSEAVSYIVTNFRDVFTLPRWNLTATRPLPSRMLKLAPGEDILLEMMYIVSRGEGNSKLDNHNATIPEHWPMTIFIGGTMKWDYYRKEAEWRYSRPLPIQRHAPFYQMIFDTERRMPSAGAILMVGGQHWDYPEFPRFYRRMRLRDENAIALGTMARLLRSTKGSVGYMDYSYLTSTAGKNKSTEIGTRDLPGHFACLLRYRRFKDVRTGKIVKQKLYSTNVRCQDYLNRAFTVYMAAYARALAIEHRAVDVTPKQYNETQLSWMLATALFVEPREYQRSDLCRWAPALEHIALSASLQSQALCREPPVASSGASSITAVPKTATELFTGGGVYGGGQVPSGGLTDPQAGKLRCRANLLQDALESSHPSYCSVAPEMCGTNRPPSAADLLSCSGDAVGDQSSTAGKCSPLTAADANAVINLLCHRAAEEYKRRILLVARHSSDTSMRNIRHLRIDRLK